MSNIKERDGIKYVLTPISEAEPGMVDITFYKEGPRFRTIKSVTPGGEAHWPGGSVKGFTVYYEDGTHSIAGRLFEFPRLID